MRLSLEGILGLMHGVNRSLQTIGAGVQEMVLAARESASAQVCTHTLVVGIRMMWMCLTLGSLKVASSESWSTPWRRCLWGRAPVQQQPAPSWLPAVVMELTTRLWKQLPAKATPPPCRLQAIGENPHHTQGTCGYHRKHASLLAKQYVLHCCQAPSYTPWPLACFPCPGGVQHQAVLQAQHSCCAQIIAALGSLYCASPALQAKHAA
jgi:hypothetical protein